MDEGQIAGTARGAPPLLEAYQRLLETAAEAGTSERLLRDCLEAIGTLPLPAGRRPAAVLLVDGDRRELRCVGEARAVRGHACRDDRRNAACVCPRALEGSGEILLDDPGGPGRAPCAPPEGGTHLAFRLDHRGDASGVLHLLLERGSRPGPEERGFLAQAATIIGAGLHRRRREEEHDRLEARFLQAQKMEAIGRIAGGVAHDFNNIITVITSYAELGLLKLPVNDPQRRNFEEILAAADRAALLTQQLLAFSRRQVLAPRVLDLNAVIAEMVKLLRRLLGEDVELVVRTAPDLAPICADPAQLEQVIINLAANSRDVMPGGGRLVIETRNESLDAAHCEAHPEAAPGPHVRLSMSDNGPGIPEEARRRIFEPFFTTKDQRAGSGLGLAAVYGIVRQSGGHIVVDSEPGSGTSFHIYIPASGETASSPGGPGAEALPRGSETVLVAEDDDAVRAVTVEVLRGLGYRVLEARTGSEALTTAAGLDRAIDLLLADVIMPRMSGSELYRALAAKQPGLRVLFVSGHTGEAMGHHGVLEPDIPLLQKPFSPAALAARVREVLDAQRG